MKTDDLITLLAADTAPERRVGQILPLAFLPMLALAGAVFLSIIGTRPDLASALIAPVTSAKFVLPGALGLLGLFGAVRLSRPEGRDGLRLRALLVVAAVALAMVVWTLWITPPDGWAAGVRGSTILPCLMSIPALGLMPMGAALLVLRRGATTLPRLAGALAGLGSGGAATVVYAMHCTEDNPLFFVTWYGLGLLSLTALGAIIGPRVLRW